MYAHRRSSLRESLGKFLARRSMIRLPVQRLKGRYLFRAAVRLVLEYMDWIREEPTVEEIVDDVAANVRMAEQKKVERKLLTLEDRSILLTNPRDRREEERGRIFELFRKFRAFRKYSSELQESLAGVCLYQYLRPGRVIVRQGHRAENLYFIATGEVSLSRVVTDDLTGDRKEVDMGTMNPGDMFGEIALLHLIPRTATVISKTPVDLFLIPRDYFDKILRQTLMKEWDVLQDALVHFNYFQTWDQDTIRECCILSRLKEFKPNEVLLGDGKGMINYVHFILEGECQLIEHMHVRERHIKNETRFELYNPEDSESFDLEEEVRRSFRRIETDENIDESDSYQESSVDYTRIMLSTKPTRGGVDPERMSTVTTTLLDVINQWHEITDVAAMLMREPSSVSQQCYPKDVRTIFMQICTFYRGACFGLGEQMANRRIVSMTPVRCFLIPRYWLLEHNRANIWERVKLFMDSKYPTRQQLFQEFVRNRKWIKYKRDLVSEVLKKGRRGRGNVTIHDVPYSIRISNYIDSEIANS